MVGPDMHIANSQTAADDPNAFARRGYDLMKLLVARDWLTKYSPEHCDLVTGFYVPALECAVRYDRSTGYFSAYALALAARGIEGLVRNGGRMRLVVGCTLKPQDLAAIQQGADLRDTVEAALLTEPLGAADPAVDAALAAQAFVEREERFASRIFAL